jgi:hypothetical protein
VGFGVSLVTEVKLKARFRSRAIALLARGKSIDQTVDWLRHRYHPTRSINEVRHAYFPESGPYSLTRLVGKSHKEALRKLKSLTKLKGSVSAALKRLNADPEFAAARDERASERMKRLNADPEFAAAAGERMKRLHSDPEFAAARDERASERMKRLHADPEFAAAAGERMKRLNADPEFRARLIDGINRFWDDYQVRKIAALGGPSGWEGGRKVPIVNNVEESVIHSLLADKIHGALGGLSPVERAVVSEEYGFDLPKVQDLNTLSVSDWNRHLNNALSKLRKNKVLKDIFR